METIAIWYAQNRPAIDVGGFVAMLAGTIMLVAIHRSISTFLMLIRLVTSTLAHVMIMHPNVFRSLATTSTQSYAVYPEPMSTAYILTATMISGLGGLLFAIGFCWFAFNLRRRSAPNQSFEPTR